MSDPQQEKTVLDIAANGMGVMNNALLSDYTDKLQKSITSVFSGEDADTYISMLHNVANFASDKTFCAMQQVLQQLDKTGGDVEAAKHVLKKFNSYLATECNTATARARTAKQWAAFNSEKSMRLFPCLRWIPSRSATPREAHRLFWNRVWRKDDPFWEKNFPGNIWNCKCDWEETSDDPTDGNPIGIPPNGKGMSGVGTNPKNGIVFDNTNVYHQHSDPEQVAPSILALGDSAFYPLPTNPKIIVHPMHNDNEIIGNVKTAETFIEHNPKVKEVKLLPNVTVKQESYRPQFYPKGHTPRGKHSNADAIVTWENDDKWVVDFKYMQGNGGNVGKRLLQAYEQGDYAILEIEGNITDIDAVIKMADSFMRNRPMFRGVIIYDNKGKCIYEKRKS